MFGNHTMTIVSDLGMVANDIRNIDLFTVAAITTNDYPQAPNIHYAGVLVPPTWMLMRWADGDQFVLQNEYPQYLQSKDCDDMIVALIAALTKKNVILYVPGDEFGIFGMYLLNHLYYNYGLVLNSPTTQFSSNSTFYPLIMSKFYMMDIMSADDYLASFPARYQLPDWVINKLAMDLTPFSQPVSFEVYKNHFNQINASKAQKEMVDMIREVKK